MPSTQHTLPEGFLDDCVAEFTDSNTVGFLLAGSHARNDADKFSDVDLMKFVRELPPEASERYVVRFREENLLCITVTTVAAKLDELRRPEKAVWAVPGIRQARIIADPHGEIAGLKRVVDDFDWTSLQGAADSFAANELAGLSEEVHKLFNTRQTEDGSVAEYAIMGLQLGLTKVAVVKLGVMIPSENSYFLVAREAVGIDSKWSANHLATFAKTESDRGRVTRALELYVDTACLIGSVGNAEDIEVIDLTVDRIKRFLAENNL